MDARWDNNLLNPAFHALHVTIRCDPARLERHRQYSSPAAASAAGTD